jgi:hypothetical protein
MRAEESRQPPTCNYVFFPPELWHSCGIYPVTVADETIPSRHETIFSANDK